jgi:mRNA interferase RelE/StbE
MFEILVSHEAEKYYKKQDRNTKRRLNHCLDQLSQKPLFGPHIKRLHGELEGRFRYEIRELRVVYEVQAKEQIVKIISIKGRGDVYK